MPAQWLQGAVGRLAETQGNLGGANFQGFSLNGGMLLLPEDTDPFPGDRGDGPSRQLVPGLQLQGPCVLIYLDGADAAKFRAMFNLPAPKDIMPMTLNGAGGGIIKP